MTNCKHLFVRYIVADLKALKCLNPQVASIGMTLLSLSSLLGCAGKNASPSPVPAIPIISTQPLPQVAPVGTSATFTVAASGTPAPGYQWYSGTPTRASLISGANANSYTTDPVALPNSGTTFFVTVSNNLGSVTSDVVSLTVTLAPSFTLQPVDTSVAVGAIATFKVDAGGQPAPDIQWQRSGDKGTTWADISGAVTTTLAFSTQASDDGCLFRAKAVNLAGSIISSSAALRILPYTADVYVTGFEGNYACYWHNGLRVPLSDGTVPARATDIALAGSDIYIVGWEGQPSVARCWRNGTAIPLAGASLGSTASGIAVSGSDVWVVGTTLDGNGKVLATCWKNAVVQWAFQDSTFNAIAVLGSSIYIAGKSLDTVNPPYFTSAYWVNGSMIEPYPYTDSEAKCILVDNQDVYIGIERHTMDHTFLWYLKNNGLSHDIGIFYGSPITLTSIFASNGDVYVSFGFNYWSPMPLNSIYYTKNDSEVVLDSLVNRTRETGSVNRIFCSGDTVFLAGWWPAATGFNCAVLWVNQGLIQLSDGSMEAKATSVVVK